MSHFTTLPDPPADTTGFWILATHLYDTGIVVNGTGNSLLNSTIAYSAGDGVAVLGTNSTIENNLIHHIDYIGDYASGIFITSSGNTIRNNTIYAVGRQAILFWSVPFTNEDVGYNNVFNAMYFSRDGGEIYACCGQWRREPAFTTTGYMTHNP